jgi:hypothetical protein
VEVPRDHSESIRKFERLMEKEAQHAHETAVELEALVLLLPGERSRQLAQGMATGNKNDYSACESAGDVQAFLVRRSISQCPVRCSVSESSSPVSSL